MCDTNNATMQKSGHLFAKVQSVSQSGRATGHPGCPAVSSPAGHAMHACTWYSMLMSKSLGRPARGRPGPQAGPERPGGPASQAWPAATCMTARLTGNDVLVIGGPRINMSVSIYRINGLE